MSITDSERKKKMKIKLIILTFHVNIFRNGQKERRSVQSVQKQWRRSSQFSEPIHRGEHLIYLFNYYFFKNSQINPD